MLDSGRPHPQRHNRTEAKAKANRLPKERLLPDIEIRFVYAGELKGTWFSLAEAMVPAHPAPPGLPGHPGGSPGQERTMTGTITTRRNRQ